MECFFSSPVTDFSFGGAFVARWAGFGGGSSTTLIERATWTNPAWNQAATTDKPSEIYDSPPLFSHTEASLWSFWIYRVNTFFCHLWLARLSFRFLPHIPILLLNLHLSSSMSRFGISFSHHSQTTYPAAHPDRVSTAVQVILRCISRATCGCFSRQRQLSLSSV